MRAHVFTICSSNYVPYARVLHESLVTSNPDVAFTLYLADRIGGHFDPEMLGFEVIEMERLDCPNLYDMAARYSIMEMNTAIKPFCFQHLFATKDIDAAVYLDPDICATSRFDELFEALRRPDVDVVLTPHSTSPLDDGKNPDDHQLMRAGAYNLGFCAIKRTRNAGAFLEWWARQLQAFCLVDVSNGIFVDQKFCDLAPSYFDGVSIFRHEGYNVAYWNLLSRPVRKNLNGGWKANGSPLRFFHFSGVVPGNRLIFSKHQDRFSVDDLGDLRALFEEYLDGLERHSTIGDVFFPKLPYAFGFLCDGTPITDDMRKVYRDINPPTQRSYQEAFGSRLSPYLMHAPDLSIGKTPHTRLMNQVWRSRNDLQQAFPLQIEDGRVGFFNWFCETKEHGLPGRLIEATKELRCVYDTHNDSVGSRKIVGKIDLCSDSGSETLRESWCEPLEVECGLRVGLDLFGWFRAETGVGKAARSNYFAAKAAGLQVTTYDMAGYVPRVDFPVSLDEPTSDVALLHANADQTSQLEKIVDPRILFGRHRIGYWVWELDSLPLEWLRAYAVVDEIWCPSIFAAQVFAQRTQKPITVIPHPVWVPDAPKDGKEFRKKLNIRDDAIVYLAAFDTASYPDRKNPQAVLSAFKSAFPDAKDTSNILVLKVHGSLNRSKAFNDLLLEARADRRVRVIDRVMTDIEIDQLQWACDVFVSLHRSEGFGLWIAECMARSKACVVTNYSGNTDFTDHSNSIPIGFSMARVEKGQYPQGEGRWWADPDLSEAVDALRLLRQNTSLRLELGRRARETVAARLSPLAIGAMIKRRLYAGRAETMLLPQLRLVD